MSFFLGSPSSMEQVSRLTPEQKSLFSQLTSMLGGQGGMDSLGNYYKGLLSGEDFDQYAAPEMRRFQQETVPGLAEQFAGMGSGALSSSGFGLQLGSAGADLGERLAQLRASLRQQGAAGLQGMMGQAFQPTFENVQKPRMPGLLENVAGGIGQGIGMFGGPGLGSLGMQAGSALGKKMGFGG